MSKSSNPTVFVESFDKYKDKSVETVLLPTPPLPDITKNIFFTFFPSLSDISFITRGG